MLIAASLPRATYYFEMAKSDKDDKNKGIMDSIRDIFYENKQRYGFKRITAVLRNQGYIINHKKVSRLMKVMSLKAIKRKEKYHSYLGQVGFTADNLINRDFAAERPNQKWSTDVSQFNCLFGKCFLSPILDMYCEDIVAWDLSLSPNFEQTSRMLDQAFKKYPNVRGLVFHSDMGWQYQMKHYHKRLEEMGILQSMSRKGNCYDNCIIESFFGTMKNEMFYGRESEFKTFDQFKQAVFEYINYYNKSRIKIKTKWMSPSMFREASMLVQ